MIDSKLNKIVMIFRGSRNLNTNMKHSKITFPVNTILLSTLIRAHTTKQNKILILLKKIQKRGWEKWELLSV